MSQNVSDESGDLWGGVSGDVSGDLSAVAVLPARWAPKRKVCLGSGRAAGQVGAEKTCMGLPRDVSGRTRLRTCPLGWPPGLAEVIGLIKSK